MKKETLVSIAERSGCSISTVSRVLSGNAAKYRISQRTVARVTEEVKRCNYTPSLLAKGLRTNRTDTIGLLIPNIENSFFAGVAGVVIRESRNYNYKVVVVDTQEDERNEQDGLSALLARRVDGIVAAPCGSNAELFASVQEGGMPLVLIDRYLPDAGMLSYVTTDNYRGAVMATEYLLENGHRRIGFLGSISSTSSIQDRYLGYYKALLENRIPLRQDWVIADRSNESDIFPEFTLPNDMPTAFVCNCDETAYKLVNQLKAAGYSIPDDISVVGYDNHIYSTICNPRLTTIDVNSRVMSTEAVDIILHKIRDGNYRRGRTLVTGKLVRRGSVKNLNEA